MLAQLLAIIVGAGSFVLFTDAFLFPEVHRKSDFTWSAVGFFYALVLWVCAGQFTGAILLGQVAGVALIGWLEWQMLGLRWQGIAPEYRARASSLGAILVKAMAQVQRIRQSVVDRSPDKAPSKVVKKPVAPDEFGMSTVSTTSTTIEAATAPVPMTSVGTDVATDLPETIPPLQPSEVDAPSLDDGITTSVTSEAATSEAVVVATTDLELVISEPAETAPDSTAQEMATQAVTTDPIDDLDALADPDSVDADNSEDMPAVVEVPAVEAPASKPRNTPAPAQPINLAARINQSIQQVLINLGIKKRPRPMIVLDRSSKPEPKVEPVEQSELTSALEASAVSAAPDTSPANGTQVPEELPNALDNAEVNAGMDAEVKDAVSHDSEVESADHQTTGATQVTSEPVIQDTITSTETESVAKSSDGDAHPAPEHSALEDSVRESSTIQIPTSEIPSSEISSSEVSNETDPIHAESPEDSTVDVAEIFPDNPDDETNEVTQEITPENH